MKKSTRIRFTTMILIVILVVITVLTSCSADNSSQLLVNLRITEDIDSRRITSTVTGKSAEASSMHYYPEYLGSGNCYPIVGTDEYIEYKEEDGILLSQGLWNIHCSWRDSNNEEILSGSTGPIWINLNTETIYVKYGTNSLELSYSVISNSINNPYLSLSIYSFIDGNISSSPLDSYSNLTVGTDSTLSATKTGNKTVYSFSDNAFNESGYYILVIKVKESASSDTILFTDVIGFVSRFGCSTVLKGSCEVEQGSSGGSSIYLPDISDPTDPIKGVGGELVVVSNSAPKDDETHKKLNEAIIQDNKVYVLSSDATSSPDDPSMILDHSNGNSSTRVISPQNADFGINLNGTNVILTSADDTGLYITENSAIIELNTGSSLTLYNNANESKDATWALMEGTRRYEANTILNGGDLNIVGNNASDNISNAKVIFQGPQCSDNEQSVIGGISEAGSGQYIKQGAININSNNSSSGGNIVLDGIVEVKAVTGISSWETKQNGFIYYTKDSSIDFDLKTTISILHGAKILAEGDNSRGVKNDTATGIYILGNSQTGTINIILDNGHINASGSSSEEEAGIRIENFKGTINITLKNNSTISSKNGYGIVLNNCTGTTVNITKDSSSTISGKLGALSTNSVPNLSKNF